MQPRYLMCTEDAFDEIPLAVPDSHWLSIPTGDGKFQWDTTPYLLVGDSAWGH